MKNISSLILTIAILFFVSPAFAATWQVDKDHTEIRFEVMHILTTVSGQFTDFKGDVVFDPENPEKGKFDFTVSVNSVNTNNGKRDNHLRSKDFFHADKFATMTFRSTRISKIGNNMFELEGDMTIKDVTQTIKTQFEFFPPKPHPFAKGKDVAGFVTKFTLDRLAYNVGNGKFLKMGVVGGDVNVEIAMEALTKR